MRCAKDRDLGFIVGVVHSQSRCCLECVPYLAAIPSAQSFVLCKMFLRVLDDFVFLDLNHRSVDLLCADGIDFSDACKILSPDAKRLFFFEFGIIQTYVNTGFECFIKCSNAVGCQKEDAIIVFKHAKKDYPTVSKCGLCLRTDHSPETIAFRSRFCLSR